LIGEQSESTGAGGTGNLEYQRETTGFSRVEAQYQPRGLR